MTAGTDYPVWVQQEGESAVSYHRFCYYLYLGPSRSLKAAYAAYYKTLNRKNPTPASKLTPSGAWQTDSAVWQWSERAKQYDIAQLSTLGQTVISNFYESLTLLTEKILDNLRSSDTKITDFGTAVETLKMIGGYISPDAIEAWSNSGSNALPAPQDGPIYDEQ